MRKVVVAAICSVFIGVIGEASAQRADRGQRLERMDRVQDRSSRQERLSERAVTNRIRTPERITEPTRAGDTEIAREHQATTDREASDDDTTELPLIVLDTRGDRARRGEILALNPSRNALQLMERDGMQVVRQRNLSGGTVLYVLRHETRIDVSNILDTLRDADSDGVYALNHIYEASDEGRDDDIVAPSLATLPVLTAAPCTIGLIDGPILVGREIFDDVIARTSRFATTAQSYSWHGAAVMSQLVGSVGDRTLSICAADVFETDIPNSVSAEAFVAALDWQQAEGVRLVNASLAGPHNLIVEQVVASYLAQGGRLVAAVGNGGPLSRNIYPAAYPDVIGVTAIDDTGALYPLSTQGGHVDVSAVGVDLNFSMVGGPSAVSGTSYAAPVVSAWLHSSTFDGNVADLPVIDLGHPGLDTKFGHGALVFDRALRSTLVNSGSQE